MPLMPGRYVRPKRYSKMSFFIIVVGGFLAIVMDLFVFGGWRYIKPSPPEVQRVAAVDYVSVEQYLELDAFSEDDYGEIIIEEVSEPFVEAFLPPVTQQATIENDRRWARYAASFEPAAGDVHKPRIVLIIDDLGLNSRRSGKVVDLPAPLTLAYLPYADGLKRQTKAAREAGHELLVHTPMEPMDSKVNPGPGALRSGMSGAEIEAAFEEVLASFDGYIGINNHMGSRLTQDKAAMDRVMAMLKERGLVFVDSVTSSGSVAAQTAQEQGIYYARRDVFLDHEETPEFVHDALAKVERVAREKGVAIAIGHPKDVTVAALREWIPTLEEKGFVLTPVSAVLKVDQ